MKILKTDIGDWAYRNNVKRGLLLSFLVTAPSILLLNDGNTSSFMNFLYTTAFVLFSARVVLMYMDLIAEAPVFKKPTNNADMEDRVFSTIVKKLPPRKKTNSDSEKYPLGINIFGIQGGFKNNRRPGIDIYGIQGGFKNNRRQPGIDDYQISIDSNELW